MSAPPAIDGDCMLMLSGRGAVVASGRRWQGLLGRSAFELSSCRLEDLMSADDAEAVLATVAAAPAGRARTLLRLRRPDGTPVDVVAWAEAGRGDRETLLFYTFTLGRRAAPAQVAGDAVRSAWRRQRFAFWTQPIRDADSLEVVREELLVRMITDDDEAIPASRFMGALVAVGLAGELDRWVVRKAVRSLAAAGSGTVLEANLSAAAVDEAQSLSEALELELETSGVDGGRLVLSLPASVAGALEGRVRALLDGLHALGVRTALDGVVGRRRELVAMRRQPFDTIKLPSDAASAWSDFGALVDLAHARRRDVVAERVDSIDGLARVRGHGVDMVQGFEVGRPRHLVAGASRGRAR